MPKNTLNDLRNHLFEAIEMVRDGEMDIESAKTIAQLGQTILNGAKIELDFVKSVGGNGTGFIEPVENLKKLREVN